MATFTGTESDDTFTATSGPDTFHFGENQGVDLIFRFDVSQDKLAYTDRSVDGFDDLEIARPSNGDEVIESNDQYTVAQGVDSDTLVDSDFVFTTPDRGATFRTRAAPPGGRPAMSICTTYSGAGGLRVIRPAPRRAAHRRPAGPAGHALACSAASSET